MQDRCFICLHFHLDRQGRLHTISTQRQPAGGTSSTGITSSTPGPARQYNVEESNVQLGVMVRKGVGGTCPLR